MTEQDKKAIEILESSNKILEDKLRILKKANKELTEQLSLCSVVNSMPTEREIKLQARKVENYIGGESELKAAEKTGKFHGFLKGVEWLSNKLN